MSKPRIEWTERVLAVVKGATQKPVGELNGVEVGLLKRYLEEHTEEELDALLATARAEASGE